MLLDRSAARRAGAVIEDASIAVAVGRHALRLLDLADGGERPIALPPGTTSASLGSVAFFPDGESLFFSSGGLVGDDDSTASLWQARLDGSPPRRLRDGGSYAALSPDGERVAYVGEDGVYVGDREGTTSRRLFALAPSDLCDSVAWSPAGDEIATIIGESGILTHDRIDIVSVAQGTTRRLLGPAALSADAGSALVWTAPDRITYVGYGDPDGRPALWEASTSAAADAPAPSRLYTWEKNDIIENLSEAGGKLAYGRAHKTGGGQVVRLTADGARLDGGLARFDGTDEGRWEVVGSLQDGRFVLFEADDEQEALFASSPGGATTPLGIAGPFAWGRVAITSDDVVITWRRGSGQDATCRLLRIPAGATHAAAAEQDIGEIPCDAWVRCARRPGAGCIMANTVEGQTSFSKLDPRTGVIGPLVLRAPLPSPEYTWDVSWDGRAIALPEKQGAGFVLIDVARGAARAVRIQPSMLVQAVTFAPDGEHLFVTGNVVDGAPSGVARVDQQGNAELLLRSTLTWLTRPVVSSDGRALGFRTRTYVGDAYMLERAE
jgi:WD40 repeat protein